jgi:hypothetical protein
MMERNEYKHTTAILTCGFLFELITDMQDYDAALWRHDLKAKGSLFLKCLQRVCDSELPVLVKQDQDAVVHVMKYQEEMLRELVTISPNDYPLIIELIRAVRERPAEVLNTLNIEHEELINK